MCKRFLVDAGADVSVVLVPCNQANRSPKKLQLFAANGTTINTYSQKLFKLDLGLKRAFHWPFILAAVSQPIIGDDFLRHFGLLVDIHCSRLVDPLTQMNSKGKIMAGPLTTIRSVGKDTPFHQLLAEFPKLTEVSTAPHLVRHNVQHHTETKGPLVFSRP
ncbi:uncharacterized protein LOC111624658 [Centruroides sculpturatus]|uniref:uncharacterized protein LOC111624658 n=1 Tax=Centruroides sculpturatus TaxID=218467 RepID=UPI000C6E7A25|nr:uncharacterized protein LOC111624658 [Centruroides sculpturatus]